MKSQGKTAAVVRHDLGTVPEYFDRAVILDKNLSEARGGNVSHLAGS